MRNTIINSIVATGSLLFLFISFSCLPESVKITKATYDPGLDNKCTISGYVLDKETGEPLIGAKILLNQSKYETNSNVKGFFTFKDIPADTYQLTAEYIGYDTVSKAYLRAESNYKYELNIELKSSPITL